MQTGCNVAVIWLLAADKQALFFFPQQGSCDQEMRHVEHISHNIHPLASSFRGWQSKLTTD